MKVIYSYILILIATLSMIACSQGDNTDSNAYRVLVIHSSDSIGEEGRPYRLYMEEQFKSAGVNVVTYHYYADLIHRPLPKVIGHSPHALSAFVEFHPDLVIVNGKEMLDIITADYSAIDSSFYLSNRFFFDKLPIVFGGVIQPDKNLLGKYKNITGFEDKIDLKRNAEIIADITGTQNIFIELDHFASDSILRSTIRQQLSDPLFVDNSDFHISDLSKQNLSTVYRDRMVATFYSSAEPYTNIKVETADTTDLTATANQVNWNTKVAELLKDNYLLQVKNDIFNNSLLKQNNNPQFTTIRANFNNPNEVRILGGYFSSMESQIDDMVGYAVQILNGAQPSALPMGEHKADYHMDYNAMLRWTPTSLSYGAYSDQFNIINAPFQTRYPFLHWIMVIAILSLGIYLLVMLSRWFLNFKGFSERLMTKIMRNEQIRRQMVMHAQNLVYWSIEDGNIEFYKAFAERFRIPAVMPLNEFNNYVMRESYHAWNLIAVCGDGSGNNKVRIHVQFGKEIHWMEFRFFCDHENKRTHTLMGTAVICDHMVEEEQMLEKLNIESNETALRQSFLSNITNDIQTPLNAVLGFSQILASSDAEFSAADKKEFADTVRQNSDEIISIMDKTIERSRVEVGEVDLKPIRTSARTFITEIFKEKTLIMPNHLQLTISCDAMNADVMMAPAFTRTVFDAFINNAIRFTVTGTIEIGFKVINKEQTVMFYCKDTGIGISPANCKKVFDRYFKVYDYDKGNGLGLHMAKVIIEKEDGVIGVDSQENVGSTFWFKLKKCETYEQKI